MEKHALVTAIVPVFNEEKTVKNIIIALENCPLIDELIVVNDGSTDQSGTILKRLFTIYNFRYIEFGTNRGKSYALVQAVRESLGDIIVFVDSDIVGLTCNHIRTLLKPLENGDADMVIGQPYSIQGGKRTDPLKPLEFLAGERALFKADILPLLERIQNTKYGIETLINLYYKSQNKKIKIEYLWKLTHLKKFQKDGLSSSIKGYSIETAHIFKTMALNFPLIFKWAKFGMMRK